MSGTVRVGISGWQYAPWRGSFYPEGLKQREELAYASSALPTIELNGSFYSLQRPSSFAKWFDETPDDFVFSVKAPRYITQIRRLIDVETPVANFVASGLLRLGHKLGPVLWQFAPSFRFDAALFEAFLALLPQDSASALALARRHDAKVDGRCWLEVDADRPLRHAVEVRHDSFIDAGFIRLLRRYGIALVRADSGGRWPEFDDLTSDFVYLRLHGATEAEPHAYESDAAIAGWAKRIDAWRAGRQVDEPRLISTEPPPAAASRDVYAYFENTDKLHAPQHAARLLAQCGGRSGTPAQ